MADTQREGEQDIQQEREGQMQHDEGVEPKAVDYNPTVSREGEDKQKNADDNALNDGK